MAQQTVLGIPVELPEDLSQPTDFAMVIKGLDSDGKVSYWTVSSDSLMNVEIIGMMRWGESVALFADLE